MLSNLEVRTAVSLIFIVFNVNLCTLYAVLGYLLQKVTRYSYSHQKVTSYLISCFLKIVTSYFTSYYKK